MTEKQILNELENIITPYLDNPCEIELHTDLFMDLAINSIDFVSIITEIEGVFCCSISEEEMSSIRNIEDIMKYLMQSCTN